MKYLKKIFEAEYSNKVGIDKDELVDFCEMNLAYLLDNGDFRIDIEYFDDLIGQYIIVIKLVKLVGLSPGERMTYQWQEVKDYVVPFIVQLNKSYKLNTLGMILRVRLLFISGKSGETFHMRSL